MAVFKLNLDAIWQLYVLFGLPIFFLAMVVRYVAINRKSKFLKRCSTIVIIICIPLLVLSLLEALGVDTHIPIFNYSLYNVFGK